MNDFEIKCFINGHQVYYDQLQAIEYERAKHVLHEMKSLGANVADNGYALTQQDIDALSLEKALQLNIDTRNQYSVSEMKEIYKEPLKVSDKMQECHTDMIVTGINPAMMNDSTSNPEKLVEESAKSSAIMNPEHFFISPCPDGLEGMETFGMYG